MSNHDDGAALPYGSGGLGLTRAAWEARSGPPTLVLGRPRYGPAEYLVSFWPSADQPVCRIVRPALGAPLGRGHAVRDARTFLPADVTCVEIGRVPGLAGGAPQTVELFESLSLAARYPPAADGTLYLWGDGTPSVDPTGVPALWPLVGAERGRSPGVRAAGAPSGSVGRGAGAASAGSAPTVGPAAPAGHRPPARPGGGLTRASGGRTMAVVRSYGRARPGVSRLDVAARDRAEGDRVERGRQGRLLGRREPSPR
jgi:hypothetical protein